MKSILLISISMEKKSFWCQQQGMYSFSLTDSSEYTPIDTTVVSKVTVFGTGIHYVYFYPDADTAVVDSMITAIENDVKFKKEYLVATMTRNNDHAPEMEYYAGLNNYINIVFDDPNLSITEIDSIADLYETNVVFEPASSISGGVYILEPNRTGTLYELDSPTLTMDIARDMWANDSLGAISKVVPSQRLFRPSDPNDSLYTESWYAEDNFPFTCNGTEVSPVGIDLDCAWNYQDEFGTIDYYSGDSIRIAVIDFDGYQFNHPDCSGMYNHVGYVAPSMSSNFVDDFDSDFLFVYEYDRAHGQNVSGIIGARMDNNSGIAGVAHNSTIIPCLSHGTTDQFNALLQHLFDLSGPEQIDIINMSFGFGGMSASEALGYPFAIALQNCYQNGRPDSLGNNPQGIILIAAAGNKNVNFLEVPSSIPYVFSVAATNPADQRKHEGDAFDPSCTNCEWGSNYHDKLDVSAPGICIWSTDFVDSLFGDLGFYPYYGTDGYADGDYYLFSGTSVSSPIVAGIAALVLEKADSLTADEVYDVIRFSCEKVGGYSYSNNWETGKCLDLGFGRVNACKALEAVDLLSTEEIKSTVQPFTIIHQNPVNGILEVQVNGTNNYSIVVVNLLGEIVYRSDVNSDSYFEVDMTAFTNGLYLLRVQDINNNEVVTSKIIKQ